MNNKYQFYGFLLFIISITFTSCQSVGGNQTGSEYMPDMAHSVAYEANTYGYYYNNRWGTEDELHKMVQPRKPVSGTIARGLAGNNSNGRGVSFKSNGAVPYYYGNTEEERTRAMNEIINNPYPITAGGLEKGKQLYNIQCSICHGEKGDGAGYLVRDDGGKYPVQPAILTSDEFIAASNGRYYHAIMHGRNLMGAYADKLSYDERWYVIQYIRSLQATAKNLVYNEKQNTFNTTDIPNSIVEAKLESEKALEKSISSVSAPVDTVKTVHDDKGHH